jgi:hypothetical protein
MFRALLIPAPYGRKLVTVAPVPFNETDCRPGLKRVRFFLIPNSAWMGWRIRQMKTASARIAEAVGGQMGEV